MGGPEVEVFVHGALCVACPGQCLTSEALGERCANHQELLQGRRFPLRFDVVEVFLSTGELPVLRHTANDFDLTRRAVY